jgi:hypothetical protein
MLDKIYASTLFKASKNKAAIRSALQSPVNAELVQQLRSYLDDEVVEELTAVPEEVEDTENITEVDQQLDDTSSDNEETAEPEAVAETPSTKSTSKPATFTSKSDHMNDLKEFENNMNEEPAQSAESKTDVEEVASENSVESSVMIQNKLDLEALQGTLNAREDTAGVSYILQKDDELWIHYNDSVNLNNVMENVIMLLRDLCYDNLVFNRLARSANAVVFEIVVTNINNYSMAKQEK